MGVISTTGRPLDRLAFFAPQKKNFFNINFFLFFFLLHGAKKAKRSNGRPVVDMTPIQGTNEKKYLFKILHCTF